ncbi:9581_t:CDS:2 [Funneliformis caledonium]|uniref:9581_t:CDS:1 n=1 Tax=Funneliformis caledonium TaxID=1117310 RepID=A0A9N8W7W4_9GLOM|nr:9581_t:CDS:2 [Funneliformis caledonium]
MTPLGTSKTLTVIAAKAFRTNNFAIIKWTRNQAPPLNSSSPSQYAPMPSSLMHLQKTMEVEEHETR